MVELKDFADKKGDKNLDQLQVLLAAYDVKLEEVICDLATILGYFTDAVNVWKEFLCHIKDERLRSEILDVIDAADVLIDKTSSGDVSVNYMINFFDITSVQMAETLSKITDCHA